MAAELEDAAPNPGDAPCPELEADFALKGPLVPRGNPLRPRAALWALPALLVPFLLMAADRRFAWGLPVGALGLLLGSVGLLHLLGTFDDVAPPTQTTAWARLPRPWLAALGAFAAWIAAVRAAVAGSLPYPVISSGVLVTGSSLLLLVSGYALLRELGVLHEEDRSRVRPLFAREGFWLLALSMGLYLPMLGSYSLHDPWETHYGEVAREILARDDWISFWWAQERWFWSKPALDFWLQALAFLLFGVRYEPDQMLAGVAEGRFPQPEWALRLPGMLLTLLASYLAYRAVARVLGRRPAFLGGFVLVTTPYWFFLSHQSMTDMPYAAALTAALALVVLGLDSDPEREVRRYGVQLGRRLVSLSLAHVVLGLITLSTLPQILYLLSRNLTLVLDPRRPGFAPHLDVFLAGSPGNCGLPGNDLCQVTTPANSIFQPAVGALIWSVALGLLLFANRGERRVQRLYFIAAWYFVALSLLAKGAPGLVLPVIVVVAALCVGRRFRDFARLELPSCALILSCVALPWYIQAFMRHGPPFTDRLLFHDMYKRAFVHVHDTNAGDDLSFGYYIWQLGYGLFPWTALAAVALLVWPRSGAATKARERELFVFLGLWFLLAFALFTSSLTKFHHYILPAVPPLALLTGVLLDRMLGAPASAPPPASRRAARAFALLLSALALLFGASRFGAGSFLGTVVAGEALPPPNPGLGGALLGVGVLGFALAVRLARPAPRLDTASPEQRFDSAALGLLGLLAAGLVFLVGRDLSSDGGVTGQSRLLTLFSYNYARRWPASLDFEATLAAFGTVFAGVSALACVPRLRAESVRLCLCVAALWCAFALNAYLPRVSPHWGQRETLLTYYELRAGPEEPLVAYQMNWKGENFYTGNHVSVFVSSGARFKQFLQEQRSRGTRVIFATTEHSRTGTLKNELGTIRGFRLLTTEELNNKFALVRIEL